MTSSAELLPGVSIIVCSFNGGDKLIPTLKHIAEQEPIAGGQIELIYIDNGSTDESINIVQDTWTRLSPTHISLTVVLEPKAGKYFALNTAIEHVRFNYFIICDDDNWLSKDYAKRIFSILENDLRIGAVGGKSIAIFETENPELPEWFIEDQQRYAVGSQGKTSGDVTHRKQLWGAGMGSRTKLYNLFYTHYPSAFLIHQESKEGHFVAEDTEYCIRLILRGFSLYYDQDLILQHYVPSERLTKDYNNKLNRRIEESMVVIEKLNIATKIFGARSTYSSFGIFRLKLLTPIRKVTSRHKNKHQILSQLLFLKNQDDPVIQQILSFSKDNMLPSASN